MTGAQLGTLLGKLNITAGTLAPETGYTRVYIYKLLGHPHTDIPAEAASKIRNALLKLSRSAAGVYLDLTGELIDEQAVS